MSRNAPWDHHPGRIGRYRGDRLGFPLQFLHILPFSLQADPLLRSTYSAPSFGG
jgi:hypothetical protein